MSEPGARTGIRIGAVSLVVVALLYALWPDGRILTETREIAAKAILSALALGAWVAMRAPALRRRPRLARGVYAVAAAASVIAWWNAGLFHGAGAPEPARPRIVHYWEQFHYQLGSKYAPELGYDGLYAASLAAQRERVPARRLPARIRDLRNNRIARTADLEPHVREVKARFSAERWERFADDHERFVRANPPAYVDAWRRDLGYNPTPAWTFVARAVNAHVPLGRASLVAFSALDVLLLAAAFGAVFHTFGARIGCASLVLFGLGYAGRYAWIGGAFLRLDWLAAAVVGTCLLERGRPAAAGALFGYATAVRIFPVLLLFGPAVLAVRDTLRGERPRWALRLAAGFAAAIAVALAAGCLTGRGADAWGEFAERLVGYRLTSARNNVGLENVVLFGGEILERALAPSGERWGLRSEDVIRRRAERRPALWLTQAALLALVAAAAWRATRAQSVVLSMIAFFALAPGPGYYWILLLALPLYGDGPAVGAALALSLAMYVFHLVEGRELVRYGVLSFGLLGLFAGWTLPAAARALRDGARRAAGARSARA